MLTSAWSGRKVLARIGSVPSSFRWQIPGFKQPPLWKPARRIPPTIGVDRAVHLNPPRVLTSRRNIGVRSFSGRNPRRSSMLPVSGRGSTPISAFRSRKLRAHTAELPSPAIACEEPRAPLCQAIRDEFCSGTPLQNIQPAMRGSRNARASGPLILTFARQPAEPECEC